MLFLFRSPFFLLRSSPSPRRVGECPFDNVTLTCYTCAMSEQSVRVVFQMEKLDHQLLDECWKEGRWPSRSAFIKHCIMKRINDGNFDYFQGEATPMTSTVVKHA